MLRRGIINKPRRCYQHSRGSKHTRKDTSNMPERYLIINHLSVKDITRIFGQIQISETSFYKNSPCWEWTGSRCRDGYAKVTYGRESTLAHRVLFAWLVHPLPRGMGKDKLQADHQCNNRACVNPVHIEAVLPKVNGLRGNSVAAINARKTHCPRFHDITAEGTLTSSGDCKKCKAIKTRHRRATDPEWAEKQRAYERAKYAQYKAENRPHKRRQKPSSE